MSPRITAFAQALHHELARIGRADVTLAFTGDERTVEMTAVDGSWHGPVTVAFGALVTCERDDNRGAGFWHHFA